MTSTAEISATTIPTVLQAALFTGTGHLSLADWRIHSNATVLPVRAANCGSWIFVSSIQKEAFVRRTGRSLPRLSTTPWTMERESSTSRSTRHRNPHCMCVGRSSAPWN